MADDVLIGPVLVFEFQYIWRHMHSSWLASCMPTCCIAVYGSIPIVIVFNQFADFSRATDIIESTVSCKGKVVETFPLEILLLTFARWKMGDCQLRDCTYLMLCSCHQQAQAGHICPLQYKYSHCHSLLQTQSNLSM